MLFFYILRSQVDVLARHLQRGMPQNFLQAEGITAMDQVAPRKGMPAGVWMKLGDFGSLLHPLKQLFDSRVRDRETF